MYHKKELCLFFGKCMKKSLLICASIVLSPAIVLGKNTQIDKQNNCKNDSKEEEKEKAVKQENSAEKPQAKHVHGLYSMNSRQMPT